MRRAVVHIGMPRTGTTTLQRILSDHRAVLAAQGILYPDLTPRSAKAPHLSHQHLGEALDGRRPAAERDELLAALTTALRRTAAEMVLLSYESFVLVPWRRDAARGLADLFAAHGFAMEVLVTVKPQSEYINSMYTWRTQFLREHRDFSSYLHAARSSKKLDYHALVQPWRVASSGRIAAVGVRDPRSPVPLVRRVFDAIGLAGIDGVIGAGAMALVENRSPGPFAVEASRRLAGARSADARRADRNAARHATRMIEDLARARGLDGSGFQGVDAVQQSAIADRFKKSNAAFAKAVWQRDWEACVAGGDARPVSELARGPIAAADEAQVQALVAASVAAYGLVLPGRVRGLGRRLATTLRRGL